ncbi:MAG: tRNA dihydrouridine(20/20a) synthase DusA [Acidithiobacillus sp.]|uniref:tRNA dihydrouridine(20/20a) synthase DusA n=1 Tax=Acidithiobacillus sp. TaxID=1872118 RepID=UPI003D06C05B
MSAVPTPYPPAAMAKTLSVAPMLDWTDRHCRYVLRQICPSCTLYTEMIHTSALVLGRQPERYLAFTAAEQPLILQLGGDDPEAMAKAAALARAYGYAGLNLNVGCPSPRVQRGNFGACLMHTPGLVREISDALASSGLPVSVKHRLGLDRQEDYAELADFVAKVAAGSCRHFVVHARNAWLRGLSPAANRAIPPLRWDWVARLKEDFPHLRIELNGGLDTVAKVMAQWPRVDGVMIGRAAYHQPFFLAELERAIGRRQNLARREEVFAAILTYAEDWGAALPAPRLTRHLHGFFYGQPGAHAWRQFLGTARQDQSAALFFRENRAHLAAFGLPTQ